MNSQSQTRHYPKSSRPFHSMSCAGTNSKHSSACTLSLKPFRLTITDNLALSLWTCASVCGVALMTRLSRASAYSTLQCPSLLGELAVWCTPKSGTAVVKTAQSCNLRWAGAATNSQTTFMACTCPTSQVLYLELVTAVCLRPSQGQVDLCARRRRKPWQRYRSCSIPSKAISKRSKRCLFKLKAKTWMLLAKHWFRKKTSNSKRNLKSKERQT